MERRDTDTPDQPRHFAAWTQLPPASVIFEDVEPEVLAREEAAASSWLAFMARTLPTARRLRAV